MTEQLDIFRAAAPPVARKCGTCVVRNAFEDAEFGDCSRRGRRHREDPACEDWFGLEELRRPLYGREAGR